MLLDVDQHRTVTPISHYLNRMCSDDSSSLVGLAAWFSVTAVHVHFSWLNASKYSGRVCGMRCSIERRIDAALASVPGVTDSSKSWTDFCVRLEQRVIVPKMPFCYEFGYDISA